MNSMSSGQAAVEYILMTLVALSLVAIMATGFRRALTSVWAFYIKQIAAACPGCPPDPRYKLK